MTTVNGNLWWLAPLVLIPILIHIIIRQRLPVVQWGAMTFLLKALRKNRRRLLLETILLLLVRTALVAAIVLVVVRPVARAAWTWLGSSRQQTVSVIVLDDSASMASSDGIRTRFDRALSLIDQYLGELPGGSEVAVLLAAKPPTELIRLPTRDLAFVRASLARLSPRDSEGAMDAAVERAGEWLSMVSTPNREMVIVSDAQASDWRRDAGKLRAALASAGRLATVFVLTVPQTSPANIAVTGMTVTGGPQALIPSLATTLWPTEIQVQLSAFHRQDAAETAVELLVDGDKVARGQVSVAPDRPTVAVFKHRFHSPGEYAVTARCDSDLFERDNQRSMVINAREHIGVLMIDGRATPEPFESATGFVRAAIWPVVADDPESVSPFDLRVVSSSSLESVHVEEYPLIVLADVSALPSGLVGQIKSAVRKGAGLLIIAGPQTTGPNLVSMFAEGQAGLLPIEPALPLDLAADAQPIGLTLTMPLAPAMSVFEDPTLAAALSRVGWRILRPVSQVRGPAAQIWARFARGGAALVANTYGQGRVIYLGAPADRKGGEFPLSPAFVPFIQQLVFHLLYGQGQDSVPAGEPLDWPGDVAEPTLVYPDGTSEPADPMVHEDAATGGKRVVLSAANRAGVYGLRFKGRGGAVRRLRHAVNLPPGESDTAMLPVDQLRSEVLPDAVRAITADEPLQAALDSARTHAELWPMGLLLLIGLVATELLLVWLFAPKQVDAQAMLQRAMRL